MLTFVIDVASDPAGPQQLWLEAPGGVLGRDASCAFPLKLPGISRQHARLHTDDGWTWTVQDLGSSHGTRLNGAPVGSTPCLLPSEGVLEVGGNPLPFQLLELQTLDVSVARFAPETPPPGRTANLSATSSDGPVMAPLPGPLSAGAGFAGAGFAGAGFAGAGFAGAENVTAVPAAASPALEKALQELEDLKESQEILKDKHLRLSQQHIMLAERADKLDRQNIQLRTERNEALEEVDKLKQALEAQKLKEAEGAQAGSLSPELPSGKEAGSSQAPPSAAPPAGASPPGPTAPGDKVPSVPDMAALRPLRNEVARLSQENRNLQRKLEATLAEVKARRP